MTGLSDRDLFRAEFDFLGCSLICLSDDVHLVRSVIRPSSSDLRLLRKIPSGQTPPLKAAEEFVSAYLCGRDADIPPLDLSAFSEKERSVYSSCMTVLFGDRICYGSLALAAGFPRAARFAGSCMRKNLFPLFIPCHRVVPSSGGIGLYSGGEGIKAMLLSFEDSF